MTTSYVDIISGMFLYYWGWCQVCWRTGWWLPDTL